jgi:predicted transcriptional regulator
LGQLASIGLAEEEERVYRELVRVGTRSLAELSGGLRLPVTELRRIIQRLQAKKLVTGSGRPSRYSASSPEIALESLLVEREEDLTRARLALRELQEDFRRGSRTKAADLIEVIEGSDQLKNRVAQLFASARSEVLIFDKPPYAIGPTGNEWEEEMISKGGVYRAAYAKAALEVPGGLEMALKFAAVGEQARVLPDVPMKLNIFDRRIALLPLVIEERGDVEGALLVHSSHLLDALIALFEAIWERALPLREHASMVDSGEALALSEDEQHLVSMLLAGMTTEAMARQAQAGVSTVERGIKRLMGKVGAETRFQAGFHLARRGFGSEAETTGT